MSAILKVTGNENLVSG